MFAGSISITSSINCLCGFCYWLCNAWLSQFMYVSSESMCLGSASYCGVSLHAQYWGKICSWQSLKVKQPSKYDFFQYSLTKPLTSVLNFGLWVFFVFLENWCSDKAFPICFPKSKWWWSPNHLPLSWCIILLRGADGVGTEGWVLCGMGLENEILGGNFKRFCFHVSLCCSHRVAASRRKAVSASVCREGPA